MSELLTEAKKILDKLTECCVRCQDCGRACLSCSKRTQAVTAIKNLVGRETHPLRQRIIELLDDKIKLEQDLKASREECKELQACHDAEMGVCEQHCPELQAARQRVKELERKLKSPADKVTDQGLTEIELADPSEN
jgi:ferredoxin